MAARRRPGEGASPGGAACGLYSRACSHARKCSSPAVTGGWCRSTAAEHNTLAANEREPRAGPRARPITGCAPRSASTSALRPARAGAARTLGGGTRVAQATYCPRRSTWATGCARRRWTTRRPAGTTAPRSTSRRRCSCATGCWPLTRRAPRHTTRPTLTLPHPYTSRSRCSCATGCWPRMRGARRAAHRTLTLPWQRRGACAHCPVWRVAAAAQVLA